MSIYTHEPLSSLQKLGEQMFFNEMLSQASQERDSIKRIIMLSVHQIIKNLLLVGRPGMPFNGLLGETYEFETAQYRFMAE